MNTIKHMKTKRGKPLCLYYEHVHKALVKLSDKFARDVNFVIYGNHYYKKLRLFRKTHIT
jgi:hypothetical protein